MSNEGPRVAQARPVRNVTIPESFRIEAVDALAEETVGHDFRERRRKELGIPPDRSILHPDQPKFPGRRPGPPAQPPVGQQPLPSPPAPTPPNPRPNGAAPGILGIGLEKLVGKFEGNGFNTILRPQNGPNGQGLSDNLLELNFTHETLTFVDSKVLGDIPNRGFDLQEDVNLRGIPYTQEIKDLANGATGKPDLPMDVAPGIHFEQGLFIRTPALTPFTDNTFTEKKQLLGPTITRMASIPHGTTINAQSPEPTQAIDGPPIFGDLSKRIIFPFGLSATDPIGQALTNVFPQLNFDDEVTKDRIPLDLKKFKQANTINKNQHDNPNNYLSDNNNKKKIINHVTFTVDTKPKLALWGGGTDNFAQLAERENPVPGQDGVTATHVAKAANVSTANANAIQVTCQYWISTVEDTIKIPKYDKATLPRINADPNLKNKDDNIVWPVVSAPAVEGVRKPTFQIKLEKNASEFSAKVRYTQIQYSQNVTLDFGTLSWPHISVATLVPATPVQILSEKDFQKV